MNTKLSLRSIAGKNHYAVLWFWLLWFSGIVAGVVLSYFDRIWIPSFIGDLLVTPITVVGLLLGLAIPLLICWLVNSAKYRWILLFAAAKGCAYGFLIGAISSFIQRPFLFIGVLLLFTDTAMLIPFLFLFSKCIRQQKLSSKSAYLYVITSLGVVGLDYFIISPFLQICFQ